MGHSRNDGWEEDYEVYSEDQVESILTHLDIDIVSETSTHFLALCPFHGNTDSPAFTVHKQKGLWICFNPSCEKFGNLSELVRNLMNLSPIQAELFIVKKRSESVTPFSERLKELMSNPDELPKFSQEKLDELHANFKNNERAQDYMRSRGFEDGTLDYFKIGYSPSRITKSGKYRKEMVTVPMHDYRGNPIGLIGRVPSKDDKAFKNSTGLPKRLTCWNIHRARREGGSVIVTEASFDAMRVHQAGYPNVIALLGGHVTDHHIAQLERYFSKVIIMTDFDPLRFEDKCSKCKGKCVGHRAGRDLGNSIASKVSKRIAWAAYDDACIYPHDAKDAGDMTDDEIRQCLKNAVSNLEYRSWNLH